jgi:hypothetical protein
LTSDVEMDTSQYDKDLVDIAAEERHFDQYGECRHRTAATTIPVVKRSSMTHVSSLIMKIKWMTYLTLFIPQLSVIFKYPSHNFDLLRPLCGWASADTIKRTFGGMTQYATDEFLTPSNNTGVPGFPLAM